MQRQLPLLLCLLFCTCAPAPYSVGVRAQNLDTLLIADAPLATVKAYGNAEEVAAPAVNISRAELERYDQSSLLSGLNRVPGVRFEERATASYRLAIRGASLRAPFGVRNTQVYWNGIPYGEPGGDVPLNFLDAINIDRLDVLKGPSGGFYGPGTAGTLLLETNEVDDKGDKQYQGRLRTTFGSFAFRRSDLVVQRNKERHTYNQLRLGLQLTDGYRDHSAMERVTAQYTSTLRGKDYNNLTRLHALYTKLDYQLPGGLNAEQFAVDPRQARPGSAEKNASIHYHNLLLGLTNERYVGSWKAETALYATGFYFDHPFNFDYKREANLGGGGRFALRRSDEHFDLALGMEGRLQYRNGQNFTNPDGTRPGELNFSDEIFSREGLLFGQLTYRPGKRLWDVTLGLSHSQLNYTVDRTFATEGLIGESEFEAVRPVSVRLAAGRKLGEAHYLYASVADGFSPPTLDEFRTNEGSLNLALEPEVGTNFELGYRMTSPRLLLEANLFRFALDEAITSFTDVRGTQLFRNAGKTRQQGFELAATYRLTDPTTNTVDVSAYGSYTYYDFTYRDLQRGEVDFSGRDIPGAAPHVVNLELTMQADNGLSTAIFYNFTDAIPLNDANDVFADSFHLLRARVGYTWNLFTVFASGHNLLDERMSFGNDLNPRFGGRYFQPAPGRNWQIGGELRW